MGDTARQGAPNEALGVVRIVMRDGIEVSAWFQVVLSPASTRQTARKDQPSVPPRSSYCEARHPVSTCSVSGRDLWPEHQ